MSGKEEREDQNGNPSSGSGSTSTPKKTYWRSASWSERSPSKPNPRITTYPSSKSRSSLPPLQPLSISRRTAEEWPKPGSDDLGEWPNQPSTPGTTLKLPLKNSVPELPPREFQLKKDKIAFFDKECSRIVDHIYLGSEAVAKNREILRKNGITHVLNCVGFVCPEYFKDDLVYKTLWLQDSPSEDITSVLYDVFDYFEEVLEQNGRVLVHCCQGISRSTSLVIAYLMWRDGQSFEDAFQYVKSARGITNPNMGFACQLLQCQKRVHAIPVSPNSVLRMFRIAPHSPYDPLHLVPKVLHNPSPSVLDSRGAFIVQLPSAIYVWIGVYCDKGMANSAKASASQVVRYERVQCPILIVEEGKEPFGFWDSLTNNLFSVDDFDHTNKVREEVEGVGVLSEDQPRVGVELGIGKKMVAEYNMDFDIFHKVLAGEVVSPFSLSGTRSDRCLPARESGWGRIRQRFADGFVKELVTVPQCTSTNAESESDTMMGSCKEEEPSILFTDPPSLSPSPPSSSPNSINCYSRSSPNSSSKSPSPLPSPSLSDHSSFFTTSPSSSNWSDSSSLSFQLSPSTLELKPFDFANARRSEEPVKVGFPFKGFGSSLAERRGNTPPSLMVLPSGTDRSLVRSWTFSHLPTDEQMTEVSESRVLEREDLHEMSPREQQIPKPEVYELEHPILVGWPVLEKIKMLHSGVLDSKAVFFLLAPEASAGGSKSKLLFVWVGRDAQLEKEQNQFTEEDKQFYLEKIGNYFLAQTGLPVDTPIQVIREGEESKEFQDYFHQLLLSSSSG